jgi:hypothetical protein
MIRILVLGVAAGIQMNVTLGAAETEAKFSVTLRAAPSCKTWVNGRRESQVSPDSGGISSLTSEFWLLGYLSGINSARHEGLDRLKRINSETILDWMDRYCKENPDKYVYHGADVLFASLGKISGETQK